MKYVHVYALFLMLVFDTSCGQNQTQGKKIIINSENKGVSTSHGPKWITRKIIQDKKGNIWIAAFDGIFRYDGKSFTNITSKVSSARFFSVLEDRKGNFWFATVGSGVYYYDGQSFRNFTAKDGLSNDVVLSLYEDKTGNIWFGTGGGASCYDGKSFRNFTTRDVNCIFQDKNGKFWFGGGNLSVFDGNTFTTITNKNGKAFTGVWSIIENKKGNILFGDKDGLWRYDGSSFTNFTPRGALSMIEDKKGNIWTCSGLPGSRSWVLSCYDGNSFSNETPTVTNVWLKEDAFFTVFESYDGSIWVGTGEGVYRYDGKTFTDFKVKKSLNS
jgi:ligand-binding sensor domain-containing protein